MRCGSIVCRAYHCAYQFERTSTCFFGDVVNLNHPEIEGARIDFPASNTKSASAKIEEIHAD